MFQQEGKEMNWDGGWGLTNIPYEEARSCQTIKKQKIKTNSCMGEKFRDSALVYKVYEKVVKGYKHPNAL